MKRSTVKTIKIILAIITFPIHVLVMGAMVWASCFKKILEE